MTRFHQEYFEDSSFSNDLIDNLSNGRPLSLYVDGIIAHLKPTGESMKLFIVWCRYKFSVNFFLFLFVLFQVLHSNLQKVSMNIKKYVTISKILMLYPKIHRMG